MEGFVDAYHTLGVEPDASQARLKAAHRRLVLRHHPDLRPAAERAAATRRVQEVNVAYGLVRDPERRANYDRLRRVHLAGQRAGGSLRATDERMTAADSAAAAQWSTAVTSAGRWAGRWWRKHRSRLVVTGLRARRAAVDVVARVLWLATAGLGCVLGFATVAAAQRLTGVDGYLLPVSGALSGLWVGSYRGWCRRLRMAGLGNRAVERQGTLARLALATLLVLASLALDARIGWGSG